MISSAPAEPLKVSVIGCGYLGAVHAAAMASLGHRVVGLDVDVERISALREGRAPFHEPGFDTLLKEQVNAGTVTFTTHYDDLADCDVHFLALGTPQRDENLGADLSYIESAIESLRPVLESRHGMRTLVVGKSTVPVGTARSLRERFSDFDGVELIWNPEFLREGFAVSDTLNPDRIVYGVADLSDSDNESHLLDQVYAALLDRGIPRRVYNYESAELVKVSANSFLATKISFINAISELCDITGADVDHVAEAIGMDDRIGRKFLRAGVGFGGGCLPKDLRGLISRAGELGAVDSFAFLREIDSINNGRRDYLVRLTSRLLGGKLEGRRIAVLGAAFKPDTDDVRDSPALDIAVRLSAEGAHVTITDPQALQNVNRRYPSLATAESTDDALRSSEMVLLLTDWPEYRQLDPQVAGELVDDRVIIDGRNALDLDRWRGAGWHCTALGRP